MYCLSDIRSQLGAKYFSSLNLATLFLVELRLSNTQCDIAPLNWISFFPDFILSNPPAIVPWPSILTETTPMQTFFSGWFFFFFFGGVGAGDVKLKYKVKYEALQIIDHWVIIIIQIIAHNIDYSPLSIIEMIIFWVFFFFE